MRRRGGRIRWWERDKDVDGVRVSFVAWGFYTMMALLNTSSWSLRLKIWTTHIPECDLIADGPRLGSRSPSLSATLGRLRQALHTATEESIAG